MDRFHFSPNWEEETRMSEIHRRSRFTALSNHCSITWLVIILGVVSTLYNLEYVVSSYRSLNNNFKEKVEGVNKKLKLWNIEFLGDVNMESSHFLV